MERAREDLFKHLRHALGKQFQMSLEVYGSAATGLYTCGSSDVDMTLILSENSQLAPVSHRQILNLIWRDLSLKGRYIPELRNLKRIYLLHIHDRELQLRIDLVINNILGLRNSEMVRTYCMLD